MDTPDENPGSTRAEGEDDEFSQRVNSTRRASALRARSQSLLLRQTQKSPATRGFLCLMVNGDPDENPGSTRAEGEFDAQAARRLKQPEAQRRASAHRARSQSLLLRQEPGVSVQDCLSEFHRIIAGSAVGKWL